MLGSETGDTCGGRRWCAHRRKDYLSILAVLLLLLPYPTHSNVPKDFEEALQNDDDIGTLLAEESLISLKGNITKKQTKDFQSVREPTGVESFTSLNRKYESHMNLLSEEAMMMSDLLPSEYNLNLERMKREIVEGSGGVNECTDPDFDVCNGALEQCNDLDEGYECTCIEGYTRVDFQCFPAMFRSGTEATDSVVRNQDEGFVYIPANDGILFASKIYEFVWISVNGVISFGKRFGPYTGRLPTWRQNILCPYWTDIDLTTSTASDAGLYYQVYDSDSSGMLTMASNFYTKYSSLPNFNPTWLLVVTWRNVTQKNVISDTKTATFQVMLATDGRATHVLYIYNRMAWTPSGVPINIGYESVNSEDRRRVTIPVSRRRSAYTNLGSNTGFPGVWKFDVGGRFINHAAICVNWYVQYIQDYIQNFWVFRRLPRCACSGFWMWWDRRFFFQRWTFDSRGFIICFRTRFSRRYWPLGRECCYRSGWWLLRDSGYAWRFDPWRVPRRFHIAADVTGKENCCDKSSKCRLYRALRPRRGCYRRLPFFFAWAFGDPHITTLDDVTYIFNGWGEYILIEGEAVDEQGETEKFMLQARTDLALNKDGNVTKATIFTAFAATDYTDTFNVELNPNRDRFILFRNGRDISVAFYADANFTQGDDEGGLTVSREDNDVTGLFASGVSVKVVLGPKLLTISVGMPDQFKGNTTGLMGNFNEDKTDEFIFPNGTQLPADSSEATLYEYGQTWQIDQTKSYLLYPERKTAADFAHPDFEPLYLDQATEDDRNAAIAKCNGDDKNLPCIFDFLATKDDTVAQSTSQTDATATQERADQSNTAPELSSAKTVIEVTVGQETTFALNATDIDSGDAISYDVLEEPNTGFELIPASQDGTERAALAKWTPRDATPTKISITVQDSKNATSDPIDVEIRLCDNCSGHGTCDFTRNRTASNDASTDFALAACNCSTGWSGDDCGVDFDACDEDPCFEGQNCTDFTPEEEAAEGRAYNCSDCPSGYEAVAEKCEDTDECTNGTHNCDQVCVNTQGSFECACNSGYRLVDTNCQDINECEEALHDCSQKCENNDGGFTCSCEDTYDLDLTDNKTCNLKPENPCASLNCSYGCRNATGGVVECFCQSGYEVDPTNNAACRDIDECKQSICSQECNNTVGSFICFCFDGYTLASDKISCEECTEFTYGKNCSEECDCGDRFSRCDPVRGCICNDGWRGTKCDDDVNECDEDPNSCPVGSVCVNIDGGRECNCPSGYERQNDGTCRDIDECETEANTCAQNCNNVAGSFTCSCRAGYTASGDDCTDVDECAADQSDCSQRCNNVVGSYNCECEFGYRLRDDRISCETVEDVCKDVNNLNCSQGCTVKADTEEAFCFCNIGYKLGTDKQTCLDIIECDDPTLNKCSHTCMNTLGGFTCSCPVGRKLDSDRLTCKVCDAQHWGVECAQECGCGVGAEKCDPLVGCVCKSGWLGQKCDLDQDECSDTSISCPANSVCVNNPGSYSCDCRTGYLLNPSSKACEDIDECEPDRNTCDQNCENTAGSFTCTCRDGFKRANDRCENINECETGNNDCEHLCRDTEGSYACSCRPGFALNITTRTSCISVEKCLLRNCSQNCQNDGGNETCFCNNGFELDTDLENCVDINECAEGTDPCAVGGATCSNVPNGGGYTCTCEDGFFLQSDGVTCQECPEGKYGTGCSETCACNSLRTESCIKYNGTCVCVSGWEGATCDTDVDECNTTKCGDHAECKNLNGSFACECEAGYFRIASDCTECDSKHWGKNCANTCTCTVNAISCNATNGFCECKDGWQGNDCASDVDECTNKTICSGTANSQCANSNGSFTCDCKDGYILNLVTKECEDVDECLDADLNTCTQECSNTVGGFECSCSVGYTGTGNNCNDTDECAANDTLCDGTLDSTCKNKPGTFECECNDGYQKNNTKCEDVDECTNTSICDSEPNSECSNYVGSYNCTCKKGYFFNSTTDNCEDFDECTANDTLCDGTPDSTCKNKPGTFECECNDGYQKNNTKCEDVDECTNTSICDSEPNSECSNYVGSYNCTCKKGYFFNSTTDNCEDVDECDADSTLCSTVPDSICINLDGTYECGCNSGYMRNTTLNKCLDVDECSDNDTLCDGEENTECENLPGGHHCVCKGGFRNNTTSGLCEDINECNGNHGCTYQCVNFLNGSHTCICEAGFVLNLDGRSCDRVRTIESEVRLDRSVDSAVLKNPNRVEYQNLLAEVQAALTTFFRRIFGDAFVRLIVIRLRAGSLVGDYNITLNSDLKPNVEGEFVKAANELLYSNISIGDEENTVIGMSVAGTNLSSGLCETFKKLTNCDPAYVCEVNNGVPECKKLPEGNDYRMIIGLSIGIPLFVVVVATIVVLLILRTRKKKAYSDERTETGNDGFARPFASQLATRGGFYNMNRGMYSPDSLSGASSDSDRNKRKKGRSSFRDSAMYSRDDRQVPPERREPTIHDETSNFSWDFLYRIMPPSETFEIRRPHVSPSESPLRSTRKNQFSNA